MKLSYDFIQSFFKEKLPPPDQLADLLMMHFFEVEEIQRTRDDFVLDVDILSSRASDCLSHMGVAREIAAIAEMKYSLPERRVKEGREEIFGKVDVEVKDDCHRYMLRGIEGVKVGESPSYIKKRLRSCGVKPINNVVDITNYVMLETGQPLHGFDAAKIEGEKVVVRRAKKREKIVTLDEKRYELDEDVLVIADEFSPIGIAGIKGGIVPEIDKSTETVYLEAANFDSKSIRKGSRSVGIRTDASLRFEYGIPCELAEVAMERAVAMICDIAKGKALKGVIDYYPEKTRRPEISFEAEEVRNILGVEVPLKNMEKILRSLEFKVQRNNNAFYVIPPYFRLDIKEKEDVVEEIGRTYGYENIKEDPPREIIVPRERAGEFLAEEDSKRSWEALGFFESYNYSFINEKMSFPFNRKELIEMEKPVSLEFKYLRPSLLPGLLRNLRDNEMNFKEVKLFEIGKVFRKKEEEVSERKMMALLSSADDFHEMKGKLNKFFERILIDEVSYNECEDKGGLFNEHHVAKVLYGGEVIGCFGEISEDIRKRLKLKSNAMMGEFDFEKVQELHKETKEYDPVSRFPSSRRDIALLVPQETLYDEVLQKIRKAGGKTLRNIELFDVYKGKEIPEGMKNFAFRLYFQHKGKTLTSKEVNRMYEKIIAVLEEVSDWKVRK